MGLGKLLQGAPQSTDKFQELSLLDMDLVDKYICKSISDRHFVNVEIPKVFGLSDGGSLELQHDAINLYKFSDASVEPLSDMVVTKEGVVWPKAFKITMNMEIPDDRNLVNYDLVRKIVVIRPRSSNIKVRKAFSLLGRKARSWSHFLVEFLPKLVLLNQLGNKQGLQVLIPDVVDEHVRVVIGDCLRDMPEVEAVFVAEDTEVICDELYWCSPVAYVCGHAEYTHMTATIIPEITRKVVAEVFGRYGNNKGSKGNKVYIGRRGGRNLRNCDEIEAIFEKAGYEIVFPHLLSFEEKANLFANATHIAGPASSGFVNMLFSKRNTKVLWFINFERCLETFMSQLLSEFPGLEHWTLVGTTIGSPGINSSYVMEMDRLTRFLMESSFDGELLKCCLETKPEMPSIANGRCEKRGGDGQG